MLLRRLALKPFGDELLTRSADFWLFSARLIIFTMATAEGIAWGYMGALMSRAHPIPAALTAGLFVFTLVWIIDAAPFLAQAIFAADVQDEMTRRNAGAVASKRAEVERPFVMRGGELRREQQLLEQQRVQEAAGVGLSGKYGRGPALETIERQLDEKRNEIANVDASRAAALQYFDRLSQPQLEQQFGVRFLAPGVHSSGELLRDLLKSPQFTGAELAIRAFLAFLFLGLMILIMHELLTEQWQRLASAARAELEPLQQRHEATLAAIDDLESQLQNAHTAAASLTSELTEVSAAHESMRAHVARGGMDGPTFDASRDLESRRRTLASSSREQSSLVKTLTRRLELRRAEQESLRTAISSKERALAEA